MSDLNGIKPHILVGKQIKMLRKQRKLTQKILAFKSNMLETALQRIETGKTNQTVKTLKKVADGLNVSIKEIFQIF